jgi:hypothetical protein
MGMAGMFMQVAGKGQGAVGAYGDAKGEKMALGYGAAMDDLNAAQAERDAQQELAKGNEQVAMSTMRAGMAKSSQRAAMAANGIDLGDGSAAEVLTSTDMMKENDANAITSNAIRAAWGHRVEATNHTNAGMMKRAGASTISPFWRASDSIAGGAGQLAQSWYSMSKSKGG